MPANPARTLYSQQFEDGLTSMTMQMHSAIHPDASEASGAAGESNDAKHSVGRASDWVWQVGAEHGSAMLSTIGLAATIEWHLGEFRKSTGIVCGLTVNAAEGFDLPAPYAEAIFEMYGEAMSNVARPARASRVAIGLTVTPQEVSLVMRDNGIGIRDRDSRSGQGIARMRALADRHNGLCAISGIPKGGGTTVIFSLPISQVL
jgi:two-component system sensor histidine kinase UhpB